jgi:hypothetical protein
MYHALFVIDDKRLFWTTNWGDGNRPILVSRLRLDTCVSGSAGNARPEKQSLQAEPEDQNWDRFWCLELSDFHHPS